MKGEVNIMKRLNHPNISKIYDVYQDKTKLNIITEVFKAAYLLLLEILNIL